MTMTIREFARLTKKFMERNAEVQIYDGADHVETTTIDAILQNREDNFYTLSAVHQVTQLETGDYVINLEVPE